MRNDPFADIRDKRIGELNEEQVDRSFELWARENIDYQRPGVRETLLHIFNVIDRLREYDVRKIMLDVVPGEDGMGHEVFAKSVDDVVNKLSEMGERLADLEDSPTAQAEAAQPHIVKLWASGSSTGVSDYLMSDGSIKTLRLSELEQWGKPAEAAPKQEAVALTDEQAYHLGRGAYEVSVLPADPGFEVKAFWQLTTIQQAGWVAKAARAAQPQQPAPEPGTWSKYVADMIAAYLGWPVGDERSDAIAGIIERRRKYQATAQPAPEPVATLTRGEGGAFSVRPSDDLMAIYALPPGVYSLIPTAPQPLAGEQP